MLQYKFTPYHDSDFRDASTNRILIGVNVLNVKRNILEVLIFHSLLLWPRKGSLMKTQTRILDNRLYYTRKIELHRNGKKSRTIRIIPTVICPSGSEISVLITVRRVHYSKMGNVPTTPLPQAFYFVKVQVIFFFFLSRSSTGRWISFSSLIDVFQVLVGEDLNRTWRKWCLLALLLFIPGCPIWKSLKILFCNFFGITTISQYRRTLSHSENTSGTFSFFAVIFCLILVIKSSFIPSLFISSSATWQFFDGVGYHVFNFTVCS